MAADAFPKTLNTWIGQRMAEGVAGRAKLNHHIMSMYRAPLQVYFRGCSDRWLGEADDIVDGFFADRLAREKFFVDWMNSTKRLRRWLINAFCFYLMEQRRQRRKDAGMGELPEELPSFEGNPEAAVDRAFAYAILQRALKVAQDTCQSQGLAEHWKVFFAHQCDGQPYAELADQLQVEATRVRRMARTARDKFRDSLRELLAGDLDMNSTERIDQEIQDLADILDA